jgi:hypothetical protein
MVEKKYPYIKLLNKIIVMNKEKKEEHKEELKYCLENLKQYIIPIIDIENEKDGNDDPKKLILLLLQDLHDNNILPEFMMTKYEKVCTICNIVSELDFLDVINISKMYFNFDIPKILEYTHEQKI